MRSLALPLLALVVPAATSGRVLVPAGSFVMGSTAGQIQQAEELCATELRRDGALGVEVTSRCRSRFDAETPAAPVVLAPFAIDRTEVTRATYAACVAAGACRPVPGLALPGPDPRLPVDHLSFADAVAVCGWQGGRLPSEAEWERAARSPAGPFPWGNASASGRANQGRAPRDRPFDFDVTEGDPDDRDGHLGLAPVGSFPAGASPAGLLDTAGNVWEWTSGLFQREPPQSSNRFDPRGPLTGDERSIRGGSYLTPASDLRTTRRAGLGPGERRAGVGVRCAYDVKPR